MMSARVFVMSAAIILTTATSIAAVAPDQRPTSSTERLSDPAARSGTIRLAANRRYFVVLGSFRKRSSAQRRCSMFGDGYVVHTDDYSNFRNGYWACVIGPLSRADADDQMWASREAVADAYVKAGW